MRDEVSAGHVKPVFKRDGGSIRFEKARLVEMHSGKQIGEAYVYKLPSTQ